MPGTVVTHQFTITNPLSVPVGVALGPFGTIWQPPPPSIAPLNLAVGASSDVTVSVTVPSDAPIGSSDAGLLVVVVFRDDAPDPTRFDAASFVTFAGPAPDEGEPVKLAWESWNGSTWARLTVQESTDSLTRSDVVEFLAPPDLAAGADFGVGARYWIRVRWDKGEYDLEPRLVGLLLNTTMAAQTVTLRDEVLGSSDGSKNLRFTSTRAPILPGQRLDVREAELPAAAERDTLEREEGDDAITLVLDARGQTKDMLVRWHEVPDFYASGPRDRHYVLDRLSGEIRFGDGFNGLVPPIGVGNVRLTFYQTGGGSAGNRAAGTIVQLKTTVPYVDKVTNVEAAAGGADAEAVESVVDRVPREVRHGGRAVTSEDYEDLARLASPEVARALCVPLANLAVDPLSEQLPIAGDVSVIIVPRSIDAKPLPSLELIRRVEDYVAAVDVPTVHLSVVGPLYIRVDVKAEVGLVSLEGATTVLAGIEQSVASFLHPLTGGLDGAGWDFGRRPHESDLYALIEAMPGVDHVRSLDVVEVEDLPGVTLTGRFLVYSGTHDITAVFEEA
jgi:predicted phage baseplate assembly protein